MRPDEDGPEFLKAKARKLEKKVTTCSVCLPKKKVSGETYTSLYNLYTALGYHESAMSAAELAIKNYTMDKDWVRAGFVSREAIKTLLVTDTATSDDIRTMVDRTVELFIKAELVDDAITVLEKTAQAIFQDEPELAKDMLKQAVHIAESEGRPKRAKILKSVTNKMKTKVVDDVSFPMKTPNVKLLEKELFLKKPKTKEKKVKNPGVKDLVSALEDTSLVPLSAAIYSGAGGYAVVRPGLVGLTPGQFREIRWVIEHFTLSFCYLININIGNMEKIQIMKS